MQIQGFCNCDDMHYVLNVLDSLSNEFQSVQLHLYWLKLL